MKRKIIFYPLISFCAFIILSCNNDKQTNTDAKETTTQNDAPKEETVSSGTGMELQAPDFTNPTLKIYFSDYTAYLKKVVTSIRNKDEAGTMKRLTEDGKQFNNKNEMEAKAKSEDEQKFTSWLMQSVPLQTEIIKSDYYKKYMEEHDKEVHEDLKRKGIIK